ncbi:MAG: hypothetical protein QW087_02915 [Methanomassiliicoccales archaeon]
MVPDECTFIEFFAFEACIYFFRGYAIVNFALIPRGMFHLFQAALTFISLKGAFSQALSHAPTTTINCVFVAYGINSIEYESSN